MPSRLQGQSCAIIEMVTYVGSKLVECQTVVAGLVLLGDSVWSDGVATLTQ